MALGLVLAAVGEQAAVARADQTLKVVCANRHSGLLRYVASTSRCDTHSETAVTISGRAPVYACFSTQAAPAGGSHAAEPRLLRRAPSLAHCTRIGQRGLTLGGTAAVHLCAARSGGLLRYPRRAGVCRRPELAVIVPALKRRPASAHHKQRVQTRPTADGQSLGTEEGAALSIVLGGASVPLGRPLSYAIATKPEHGSLSGKSPDLTYTPAPGYSGSDQFSFTAAQGGHSSAPATVAISILHVNRAPTILLPLPRSIQENESLTFSALGADAISVADSDAEGGSERLAISVEHGTLTLGNVTKPLSRSGEHTGSVTIEGTLPALNEALEGLLYVPAGDYVGSDTLRLEADDLGHSGIGGARETTVALPISVGVVVYDEAHEDTYSAVENETLVKDAGEGVLANDSDSHALPLSAVLVKGPEHGTLSLKADGSFEYVPAHDYVGPDSFTYKDNDTNTDSGTVTVTLSVEPVAFDTAVADSYTTDENVTLVKDAGEGVLANDTDLDSPALPLEAVLVQTTEHGSLTLKADGSFEYVPNHDFYGTDTFTYKDNDTNTDSNTVTVTLSVLHVNEAPVLQAPAQAQVSEHTASEATALIFSKGEGDQITMSDADAEGGVERLQLSVAHGTLTPGVASGLTVSGAGTASLTLEGTPAAIDEGLEGLTYSPALEYAGPDTLLLEANDLGHTGAGSPQSASASVSITVLASA